MLQYLLANAIAVRTIGLRSINTARRVEVSPDQARELGRTMLRMALRSSADI